MPSGRYRRLVSRYGPFVAIGGAVALVIAIAPTTTPVASTPFAGYRPNSSPTTTPAKTDCTREAILGPTVGCEPVWNGGDNGGSTYPGVSPTQINLVYYEPKLGSQINAIAQSAGSSSPAIENHAIQVYAEFMNRYFQTYGRHVNVQVFYSDYQVLDPAASRADAVALDQQYHAFLDAGGVSPDFLDEAARRGIESISAIQMPQSFYASHTPFMFGVLPSTDTTMKTVTEYIEKRLGRRSIARFGGATSSPRVNGKLRRYGIIYPTTNQDGSPSVYSSTGPSLRQTLSQAGIPVSTMVGYSDDLNSVQTQATNIVQQLQSAGTTTIVCLCDTLTPIFLTKAATTQGYFPEWLQTGFLYEDADQVGRLYDQSQWAHDFGVSSLPVMVGMDQSLEGKAWKAIDPSTEPPVDAGLIFGQLILAFTGIEEAGPHLTPRTFADGMFKGQLQSKSPYDPTFFYSTDDYGGIKDAQEVWWDPNAVGPDGIRGHYQSVDGGYRYRLGQWPHTPTQAFNPQCLPARSCGAPWFQ